MTETAVAPELVRAAGMIMLAALAATALLAPTARARAWSLLAALGLTPVLLLLQIWNSPQLDVMRDHPLVAVAAGVAAAGIVVVPLALLFARRPGWLAACALGALPFRVPVEAGGQAANLLVPLYLVIAAGGIAWAVPRLRSDEEYAREGWLERLLAASVVLYAVQAAYSSDLEKALEQTVFFYVPFALLFVVLRDVAWTPRRLRVGLCVLTGLALVFAAIGFWEYATRELLLNPKVIASNQFEQYFRVNSLFFDPNIYGRFLALVMLGLAGVLLWNGRQRTVLGVLLALAVLWGGLLLTLSQSSFAALIAGLLVLAALRFPAKVVVPSVAAVAAAALVVLLVFSSDLRLDLGDSDRLDDATSGRVELMEGGVALARDRPVWGWGSGAFATEYRQHERTSSRTAVSASHTIPITVAAEQGVIGLAVYVLLLAAALVRLLRGARGDPARAVVAAGFVAVVVHTWTYAAFLEDPVTWTLLAVGTALALRPARAGEAAAAPSPPARRHPAAARA